MSQHGDQSPSRRPRLGVVVNSFPAVSETFIANKVTGLARAGLDVTVFASRRAASAPPAGVALVAPPRGGRAMAFAIPLARAGLRRPTAVVDAFAAARAGGDRAVTRATRTLPFLAHRLDVLHFEFSGLAVAHLPVLSLLGDMKLVVSCRGAAEQIHPLLDPGRGAALRTVFSRVDLIHCVSDDMRRTVEGFGATPEKILVNRPAVDAAAFQRTTPYGKGDRSGSVRLLSVGRLHWKKGLEEGVLAVHRLVEQGLDVRYRIVGEGFERERLTFLIHELGLASRVELLGSQPAPEVRRHLEEADILLLPSSSEGLSNAVLEAMAMELPVVTTTAGGMTEAIDDGVEGYVVAPHNVGAMADRVGALAGNPALRLAMGQRGRARVLRDFTLERQVSRFVAAYEALLGDGPGPDRVV